MPVCVAQTVQKGTVRSATVCHDGYLVSACSAPHTPGCTASRHVCLEEPQSKTLVGELERRHGVVACRGKRLAAVVILSRSGACRSPGLAGTHGASRQVPLGALVSLPGKLLLPGSCALSGLPGKLLLPGSCALSGLPGKLLLPGTCLLGLKTLFLNGSKGTTEELGSHLASPAAGCCDCPCTSSGY